MKLLRIILLVSVLVNILLLFIILNDNKYNNNKMKEVKIKEMDKTKNPSEVENFHKIFVEKDKKCYKEVFNKNFPDLPLDAFMLSCTYFMMTKDTTIIGDMETISFELESIYGESPNIDWKKMKNR